MNNMNINIADMSQLYFMLGVASFVRLWFLYKFTVTVTVCELNDKLYTKFSSFEKLRKA